MGVVSNIFRGNGNAIVSPASAVHQPPRAPQDQACRHGQGRPESGKDGRGEDPGEARLGDTALLEEARAKARTFAEFTEDWLKHVEAQRKPGTSEKYEMILRKHWRPGLGRLPLTGVTRDHIKTMLGEKLGAGLKPRTVRGHLDVLRACLSVAVATYTQPPTPLQEATMSDGKSQVTENSVKVYYRQG